MTMLHDFLQESALLYPDKQAIIGDSSSWTYRDLDSRANQLARRFLKMGLARGDRVALFLPNSWEMVVAVFATLKAGGVFVPLSPGLKEESLRHVLSHAEPRLAVTDVKGLPLLAHVTQALSTEGDGPLSRPALIRLVDGEADREEVGVHAFSWQSLADEDQAAPRVKTIDIDLAAMIYTSGSTGIPKGIMLTHRNMVCASTAITTYLELSSEDVILSVLPMSFDYGLYQALMAVQVGATLVLGKSFTYPAEILPLIARHKVTGFPLVPTMSAMLLGMDLSSYDLSSLRFVTSTAAIWPYEHIVRLEKALGGPRIYSMYGLTECKRVSYLPPEDLHRKPGSVGIPIPNTEVMILGEDGQEVPQGEAGHLFVRGGHVMLGYWRAPEATERRLTAGRLPGERWLKTGDLFRQDEEGYLYFVGRVDDMMKSRGEKVSPREIEDLLHRFPGVSEASVFGVPDPLLGEAVVAYVAPLAGQVLDLMALRRFLRGHLEDFKLPKILREKSVLPRTPNGKIDKELLKKSYLE